MNHKFILNRAFKGLSLSLLTSALSFGAIIYDSGIHALQSIDPTQLGRLSRSGTPSDWSAQKAFPGVLNPAVSYHYETFVIPSSPFPFLQISFDDLSGTGNTFASAYLNSYNPSSTATNHGLNVNYLGDAGFSSGFYPAPDVFQVVLPSSSSLVLVVNDTSAAGAGLGVNFNFIVEGFYDTSFNDTTPPVPEPTTKAFSAARFALPPIVAYWRKRSR